MIDKSGQYWHSECADDIDEYLKEYSENPSIDINSVVCRSCGKDIFKLWVDYDEEAIQVECTECGSKKILLDCVDVWEDASPELCKCPVCRKTGSYNVKAGFIRKENHNVKWIYIGNRCTDCGVLGSCLDWKISYEPTDEMENNI
ncbi:MAG: hypothetical protein K2J40_06340 [Ruminococcus sp.]|nr:hypothetical protein [Ruminococcus sp.]